MSKHPFTKNYTLNIKHKNPTDTLKLLDQHITLLNPPEEFGFPQWYKMWITESTQKNNTITANISINYDPKKAGFPKPYKILMEEWAVRILEIFPSAKVSYEPT